MTPRARACIACLLLLLPATGFTIDAEAPFDDPAKRALYESLTEEVRCLVCQNQSLADSTAPLAADLRREIRERVEAGEDEQAIKQFLTDRYGEFVLYRPRLGGATVILWLAPLLLLALGGLALWRIVRRRRSLPVTSEDEDARSDSVTWE